MRPAFLTLLLVLSAYVPSVRACADVAALPDEVAPASPSVEPGSPALRALADIKMVSLEGRMAVDPTDHTAWIEMVPLQLGRAARPGARDDSVALSAVEREARARALELRRKRSESDLTAAASGDRADVFRRMAVTEVLDPLAEELGMMLHVSGATPDGDGEAEDPLSALGLSLEATFSVDPVARARRIAERADEDEEGAAALVPISAAARLARLERLMDVRTRDFTVAIRMVLAQNRVLRLEAERAERERFEITMRQMAMMNALVEADHQRRELARGQATDRRHLHTVARRVEPVVAARTSRVLGEQNPLFSAIYRQLEANYTADLASNGGVPIKYDELDIGKAAVSGLFSALPFPGSGVVGELLFAAYQQRYMTVQKDMRRLRSRNLQSLDTAKESFARIAEELTRIYGGLARYLSEDGVEAFGRMLARHIMDALGKNVVVSSHLMRMLKAHWGIVDDPVEGGRAAAALADGDDAEEEPGETPASPAGASRAVLAASASADLGVPLLTDEESAGTAAMVVRDAPYTAKGGAGGARSGEDLADRFIRLMRESRLAWMREAGGDTEYRLAVARERQGVVERFCVAHACHRKWPSVWLEVKGGEGSVDAGDVFDSLGLETDDGRFTPVSASIRMLPTHLRPVPRGAVGRRWFGMLRSVAPAPRFQAMRDATEAPSGLVRYGLPAQTNLVFRRLHVELRALGGGIFQDPLTGKVYHSLG